MLTLTPTQARVLGALIEKKMCTPEYYPLTTNALRNACNQKSSREPVMNLEVGELLHTIRELEAQELVTTDSFTKTEKFYERLSKVLQTNAQETALIALLLLRGPQTLNQLLTRSARYVEFTSETQVRDTLLTLAEREEPLTLLLPKTKGVREPRYMHLLSGEIDMAATEELVSKPMNPLEEKIAKLEKRMLDLEERIEELEG